MNNGIFLFCMMHLSASHAPPSSQPNSHQALPDAEGGRLGPGTPRPPLAEPLQTGHYARQI